MTKPAVEYLEEWVASVPWLTSRACDDLMMQLDRQQFEDVDLLFRPFEYFDPDQTKVVIVGEQPYDEYLTISDGLAFSVHSGIEQYPSSLISIFDELFLDAGVDHHHTGSLDGWARQGVLLLNSSLTHPYNPLWNGMILDVVQTLLRLVPHLVVVKWGDIGADVVPTILSRDHLVLTAGSPARIGSGGRFIGSRPFSRINHFHQDHGIYQIDWSK